VIEFSIQNALIFRAKVNKYKFGTDFKAESKAIDSGKLTAVLI